MQLIPPLFAQEAQARQCCCREEEAARRIEGQNSLLQVLTRRNFPRRTDAGHVTLRKLRDAGFIFFADAVWYFHFQMPNVVSR